MTEVVHDLKQVAEKPAPRTDVEGENVNAASIGWVGYATFTMIVIAVVSGALALYHHYVVAPGQQRVAVIDIAEVLELKEMQVTLAATASSATDEDRARAFGEIARFASEMERAVGDIQNDCQCVLLVRSAVVKSKSVDMTQALKDRLGIASLEKKDLLEKMKTANRRPLQDDTGNNK